MANSSATPMYVPVTVALLRERGYIEEAHTLERKTAWQRMWTLRPDFPESAVALSYFGSNRCNEFVASK